MGTLSPEGIRRGAGCQPAYLTTSLLRPAIWRDLRRLLPSCCSTYCRVRLRGPQVENAASHNISLASQRDVMRNAGQIGAVILFSANRESIPWGFERFEFGTLR